GTLDIESGVTDGRAAGGENGKAVFLLDINEAHTGLDENRMQFGGDAGPKRLAAGFCGSLNLVIAKIEVIHDLNDLDGFAVDGVGEIGGGVNLRIVRIGVGEHASTGRQSAEPYQIVSRKRHWNGRSDGECGLYACDRTH